MARNSVEAALDFLCSAGALKVQSQKQAAELANLAARFADYSKDRKTLDPAVGAKDDIALITFLKKEIGSSEPPSGGGEGGWESLGTLEDAWTRIGEGLSRAKSAIGNLGSGAILSFTRSALNDTVSRFLGDVLVYLDQRGDMTKPGPIVKRILGQLSEAAEKGKAKGEKFVVVAHSMGGNVTYDILTHFAPDLEVDAFVTVGSQVGLFEELKLFRGSAKEFSKAAGRNVPKPSNVGGWINVFDQNDILSYSTRVIFEGTDDFAYGTGVGVMGAHGAYFTRPSFYRRLAERLRNLFP
jgi:hypothetical protein